MATAIEACVKIALASLADGVTERFAADPLGTLRQSCGLRVQAVNHLDDSRRDGGVCDGISYLSDGVILYRSTGNRRENFTLAHELGHYLVDRADAVYDILSEYDDAALMLETVCDRIARLLLLPDDLVSDLLGGDPVQAKHVMELYRATNASVQACAIALKDRLPTLGAVASIDRATETVRYASIRPDDDQGWPAIYPWPGQPVPPGHPLRSLKPKQTLRRSSFWITPWGRREGFYVDAIGYSTSSIVVFSANDLWQAERFHPAVDREFDRRPRLTMHCCGQTHEFRGWPCNDCGQGYCPTCGKCRCERRAASEVLCAGNCFRKFLPHLLVNGLCEECR